jgi:hypothetical protein
MHMRLFSRDCLREALAALLTGLDDSFLLHSILNTDQSVPDLLQSLHFF